MKSKLLFIITFLFVNILKMFASNYMVVKRTDGSMKRYDVSVLHEVFVNTNLDTIIANRQMQDLNHLGYEVVMADDMFPSVAFDADTLSSSIKIIPNLYIKTEDSLLFVYRTDLLDELSFEYVTDPLEDFLLNAEFVVTSDSTVTLIKYLGYSKEVVIPGRVSIGGREYDVTGIGSYSFVRSTENPQNCRVVSVSLPNTVTSIEDKAFYGCSNLAGINIPEGVARIGEEAFAFCESIEKLNIPRSVVSIGTKAFYNCLDLEAFIDNKVGKVQIGLGTFGNCKSVWFNNSDLLIDYQEIGTTDYSHVILYGQSLGMGWQAGTVITTDSIENCYMVGSLPLINHGNDGSLVFNPLVSAPWSSGGEEPIVALTHAFAKQYNNIVDKDQKFVGTNCGEGGRSIEKLSKNCTNGTNFYDVEFMKCLRSASQAALSEGKTISCSAIVFMQGEYNYIELSGNGLIPNTNATSSKDEYKAYLLKLKNDMQADIMKEYGQTKKPLFFIYMIGGYYINNRVLSINMAQVEFALENDDVFLLNPTYFTPDYGGGHLSVNGYRWYGESMAKSLSQVFINKEDCMPIVPFCYTVQKNELSIDCYVPAAPLVFDTWTKESVSNYGFVLLADDKEVPLSDIKIEGNKILLKTSINMEECTKLEISYAGYGRNGSGNVRDSDSWQSLYNYWDDSTERGIPNGSVNYRAKDENGVSLVGKPYPLQNWLVNFYKRIK
ncbi:MAG: leucine-rich repeat domain-containing protein [Paludibacteraceae bacterium]|nr:leucine-rich repeat domain-containing protein [Paludibacteraceae bacterium]